MTLTTAYQVRLRIQDMPHTFNYVGTGDGQGAIFDLPVRNITSASAFIHGTNGQWSATGATIDASGIVSFSGVITANSGYLVRGVQSVFSDAEIDHFTAVGGSVAGAALEAVRVLQFDALKRASWAAPDGTTYDDTKAMEKLDALEASLKSELDDAQLGAGGFVSWAMGQTGL